MVSTYGVTILVVIHIIRIKYLRADNQTIRSTIPRQLRPMQEYSDGESVSITSLEKHIINGVDASVNRYPYKVSMMHEDGESYCGGTLVAPDIVLTVAHCKVPQWITIGRHDLKHNNDASGIHGVLYSYRHPLYVKDTFEFDMKLLKLIEPSRKSPVRLNNNPNIPDVMQGKDKNVVTVIGFGKTQNSRSENILQEVDLNAISNEECRHAKDGNSKQLYLQKGYEGKIFENMLCLTDMQHGGKDACTGKFILVVRRW